MRRHITKVQQANSNPAVELARKNATTIYSASQERRQTGLEFESLHEDLSVPMHKTHFKKKGDRWDLSFFSFDALL
jgi:hypothetical protein